MLHDISGMLFVREQVMQVQEAHYHKRSHKRFTLAIIIFLLLIGSGVFWIMNKDKGSWFSIFVIVFTVLGVV